MIFAVFGYDTRNTHYAFSTSVNDERCEIINHEIAFKDYNNLNKIVDKAKEIISNKNTEDLIIYYSIMSNRFVDFYPKLLLALLKNTDVDTGYTIIFKDISGTIGYSNSFIRTFDYEYEYDVFCKEELKSDSIRNGIYDSYRNKKRELSFK